MSIVAITGCSSGFGEALALAFTANGHQVIAALRRPREASPALQTAIAKENIVALDVANEGSRDQFVTDLMARHGRLDILVNNAGISCVASIEDTPEDVARRIFDTNYFGPLALMKKLMPIMRAQHQGRIVNITAMGAFLPTPLLGVYCASKSALDASSAAADIEGRSFGIRVLTVLPGQFKTAIAKKSPQPIITLPYAAIAAALDAHRAAHAVDIQSDYAQVIQAVVAAATDKRPSARYLAGIGLARRIEGVLAEMERIQDYSTERAGLAPL